MEEQRKTRAHLRQGDQSPQLDARRKLNPASRCNLDPVRSERGIVTDRYEHRDVHQRAVFTNVLVAPVSRANCRMPLPLGPVSSARMTIKACCGSNEKLTTRFPYPRASCPCIRSQTVWD